MDKILKYNSILRLKSIKNTHLIIPAALVAAGMFLPVFYLILRAIDVDQAVLQDLIWRTRNFDLLMNTLSLIGGVIISVTVLALPLAWLITRTTLTGRKIIKVMGTLPLAIPGYVMAYTVIGLSGYQSFATQLFGLNIPRIEGYSGALLALSLYTFPYLFLNICTALQNLENGAAESARCMGFNSWQVFWRITLPQLRPSLLSGWLIIALYVAGDFGTVTLMRYDTFSHAIYTQYIGAFDRTYTAWLSLMLLSLAGILIIAENATLGARRYAKTGTGTVKQKERITLNSWQSGISYGYIFIVIMLSLGMPIITLLYWFSLGLGEASHIWESALGSIMAATPAAILTVAFAVPIVFLKTRHPSMLSKILEQISYIGYALPPLALGLAFVFFALSAAPILYQTFTLLIIAYIVSFIALAIGPIRSRALQMSPNLHESARALGKTPQQTFFYVTLPILKSGFISSFLLIFMMIMKELPLTFLLAPTGYTTLATTMFSRTSEGLLIEAAPYALGIITLCACAIIILAGEEKRYNEVPL